MNKRKKDKGGLYQRLRDLILGGDDADTDDFVLPEELRQKYRKICEELKACPPEERESKRKELEAKYHVEISFDPDRRVHLSGSAADRQPEKSDAVIGRTCVRESGTALDAR